MARTVAVPLADLVRDTFERLHAISAYPREVVLGPNALADGTDVTLTLAPGATQVSEGELVEYGRELMRVIAKSDDSDPVYTVTRRYLGTPSAGTVSSGSSLRVNPQWSRDQVARAIVRALRNTIPAVLPLMLPTTVSGTNVTTTMELPDDTLDVVSVSLYHAPDQQSDPFDQWQFEAMAPPNNKSVLRVPRAIATTIAQNTDYSLYVTRVVPYAWSGGAPEPADESETVTLYTIGQDLPVLWAAAYLVSGREINRLDIDKVEEWNHEAAIRQGVNLRLVQQTWNDFYQKVEEAKRLLRVPKHRPYVRRKRLF